MSLPMQASTSEDPRYTKSGAIYVPAGEGITKWVAGDVYTMKATAKTTNGSLGLVEASVPPGGGPVAHVHNSGDEAFYLLSGELEFLDGDRTYTAQSGDFLFVPRGIRHRFTNKSLHTAKLLFMFTPGGLEASFVEGGDDPQPGVPVPPWDMARFGLMKEVVDRLDLDTDILPEMP
ncbi:cupin domain-containing protein [Micromonospora sp. NPDC048842]|uniref:cupin domain-containing protein n=1 Tax=unclassified Micromonospora TaxID=2617518 RepID=UPI0033E52838